MALTSDEFRNRVVAAGALHGRGMREIRDLLAEFGTEKTLHEAVIRGDKDQNKRNIRDLAEALEVPREWFTEPDWRDLIPGAGPAEDPLAEIRATDEDEAANLPAAPSAPKTAEQEREAGNP